MNNEKRILNNEIKLKNKEKWIINIIKRLRKK
jgi:hypothetical protein